MIPFPNDIKSSVFCVLSILSIFIISACGDLGGKPDSSGSGKYRAKLIFPPDTPRISSDGKPGAKAVAGIDCSAAGFDRVRFTFRNAQDQEIAGGNWPCSAGEGRVSNIPPGSDITVIVTVESNDGTTLLRGLDTDITIAYHRETRGDDIALSPADAPSVVAGSDPKTIEFDWAHIEFPPGASHYQIQISSQPGDEFTAVRDAFIFDTQFKLPIPIHLTDWENTRYRVAAYDTNNNELQTSAEVRLKEVFMAEDIIGYFKADNPGRDDGFGAGVALSEDGSVLAVGAPFEDSAPTDNNSGEDSGAVYIYARSQEGTWSLEDCLKPDVVDAGDHFGEVVALSADGGTLAVSAAGGPDDNAARNSGVVYIFVRDNNDTWQQAEHITPDIVHEGDGFGRAVALSRDGATLVVGAPFTEFSDSPGSPDDERIDDAGAAYIFIYNNITEEWNQTASIRPQNPGENHWFGSSIALSGDGWTLVAGARREDNGTGGIDPKQSEAPMANAGAVYVFTRQDDLNWPRQAYIKADPPAVNDYFGGRVSLSSNGDTLAVTSSGDFQAGVHLFARDSSGGWRRESDLGSIYGINWNQDSQIMLSSDGNRLVVGTVSENSSATGINGDQTDGSMENSGAAYLLSVNATRTAWVQTSYIKAGNTDAGDRFGTAVALSADGDTLAVGAVGEAGTAAGVNGNQNANSLPGAGAVYLY